jgi:hypothetical protein
MATDARFFAGEHYSIDYSSGSGLGFFGTSFSFSCQPLWFWFYTPLKLCIPWCSCILRQLLVERSLAALMISLSSLMTQTVPRFERSANPRSQQAALDRKSVV